MQMREGAARIADVAFKVVAALLAASLVASAWHDVSKAWDVWAYHLPFAARITGIVGADSYRFHPTNDGRYAGFPLALEAAQGALWRITGRPECANFVALASLPALAFTMRRFFAVPIHVTFLALLAVPLVQIHATQCYVDLPANASATILLLCAYRAVVTKEPPSLRLVAGAAIAAAITVNAKFQLAPIVLLASCVLLVRAVRARSEAERGAPLRVSRSAPRRARIALIAVALPIVFATPLKNTVKYGNPVWPVELHVAGKTLPYTEGTYESAPWALEHASRPRRFVWSLLEVGLRPISSERRWSIDQWAPPEHPGKRMGGFFGGYVVVNVIALAAAAVRRRTRESRAAVGFALGAGVLTSVMPQCHELRYYLYFMLLLVCLNLALWARELPRVVPFAALLALAAVVWSTRAAYLYPSGDSFATLLASRVDARIVESAAPGETICVSRDPWTFLYAAPFHPTYAHKRYLVQEAVTKEECGPARFVDPP